MHRAPPCKELFRGNCFRLSSARETSPGHKGLKNERVLPLKGVSPPADTLRLANLGREKRKKEKEKEEEKGRKGKQSFISYRRISRNARRARPLKMQICKGE